MDRTRKAVLAVTALFPVTFTVLTARALVTGDASGMLAAGLLASLGWTVWVFLATF
jgi:hypothetical protein